jgi:diguanylate cyclase
MGAPMKRCRLLLVAVLISLAPQPPAQAAPLRKLDTGWEYRWDDERSPAQGWTPIAHPSNPPGREDRTLVTYRLTLPSVEVPDARLFVYSVDLALELSVDGQFLYRWGDPRAATGGRLRFEGWPWHLVSLPPGYGGKTLYATVASDYQDIGLWGDVLLGSGYDQMLRITLRDTPRLVVAALSLTIAVIFAALYTRRREPASLMLALVTASLVARVIAQTQMRQIILFAPLAWEYVHVITSLLVMVFVGRLFQEVVQSRYRSAVRVITASNAAALLLTVAACATGFARLCDTHRALDALAVGSMVVLGAVSVRGAIAGNWESRVLTANFVVLGLLALYSTLVSNGVLPWSDEIDYLLLFQFSVGLALLLGGRLLRFYRRFEEYASRLAARADEARVLNERLEEKVAERTRQLERANRRLREEKVSLQITSITDGLTGLYNRTYTLDRYEKELGKARRYGKRLSIIMFDLDQFKRVNDSHGHQAGDLVMQRVGGLLRDVLRESDIPGRYGGEEFLIVLPETDAHEAARVSERIRSEIAAFSWPQVDLKVTISGGIAQFAGETGDQLLSRADFLLYKAKEAGRNRIVTEPIAAGLNGGEP